MADELALTPANGIRVIWDRPAVMAYARADAEVRPAWRLEGALDDGFSALRVLSAAAGDGSLLLLAAARPETARAHDEELVAALLTDESGVPERLADALVSTEYGPDGSVRRVGLELYKPGNDYPLRAAGDTTQVERSERDGLAVERAGMSFRLQGRKGRALYEIVRRD